MLVAQAMGEGMVLLSGDPQIARYPADCRSTGSTWNAFKVICSGMNRAGS